MATLQRCELWDNYQCAGGVRLAVLPLDHITSLRTVERTTREDDGTLVIAKDAAAYASLAVGSVLRLLFTDGTFTEWRIRSLQDESRRDRVVTAVLSTPLLELATGAAILSSTTSLITTVALEYKALTPADVVTKILTFCPGYWAAGTITPTIPVNLTPMGWMPLQALRELVAAIRAQGVNAELDFRRNGTTGYYLDIVSTIGGSATALDVRTAKNLLGTSRLRDRDGYALEVVPLGNGDSTMARAFLEVTNKSGTTLTVQQPVGGGPIIAFDGQFDGLYLYDDAGARQLISSSLAVGTFVVASAANITTGRWYRLAVDSAGTDLIRMRKAPATAGPIQVIRAPALDATSNIVGNPAMRVWPGSDPTGWTTAGVGATFTKTTTAGLWQYGGQSLRCQFIGAVASVTGGLVTIWVPNGVTAVTWSCWVYVTTATNASILFKRDGATKETTTLSSFPTGQWVRHDFTETLTTMGGALRTFQVIVNTAGGGSDDFYVDAAQISFTASAQPFVEGSNPTRLMAVANRYLTRYSTVPAIYRLTFADLGQWDPSSFRYDDVSLGQTANVKDTDLTFTVSARVVDLERDWKNPLASELTVSSRPDDLVTLLTGLSA